MTDVLPPRCMSGREQREEPHEHITRAGGRDEVVIAIERDGRRPRERVLTRTGQPGLGRRRGRC